jgi:hypothetical protein
MTESYQTIRDLIDRVRRRWRTLHAFEAIVRAGIASTVVVGIALTIALWTNGAPRMLATVGIAAALLVVAAVIWGLLPLRNVPDDRHVARFIEERAETLDDRLVSAVDVASAPSRYRHRLARLAHPARSGDASSDCGEGPRPRWPRRHGRPARRRPRC